MRYVEDFLTLWFHHTEVFWYRKGTGQNMFVYNHSGQYGMERIVKMIFLKRKEKKE